MSVIYQALQKSRRAGASGGGAPPGGALSPGGFREWKRPKRGISLGKAALVLVGVSTLTSAGAALYFKQSETPQSVANRDALFRRGVAMDAGGERVFSSGSGSAWNRPDEAPPLQPVTTPGGEGELEQSQFPAPRESRGGAPLVAATAPSNRVNGGGSGSDRVRGEDATFGGGREDGRSSSLRGGDVQETISGALAAASAGERSAEAQAGESQGEANAGNLTGQSQPGGASAAAQPLDTTRLASTTMLPMQHPPRPIPESQRPIRTARAAPATSSNERPANRNAAQVNQAVRQSPRVNTVLGRRLGAAPANRVVNDRSVQAGEVVEQLRSAIALGSEEQAEALLDQLASLKGENDQFVLKMRAFFHIKMGRFDQAGQALEQILAQKPDDLEAQQNMIIVELRTNRVAQARNRWTGLVSLYPQDQRLRRMRRFFP